MLPACRIAPATTDLHPALADLWVAAWTRAMPQIDFEARRGWLRARLVERPAGDLLLTAVDDGGAPLGFVLFDPATGWLDQIAVDPRAQGRGIAQALLAALVPHAPGVIRLDVNADNPRALAFYERAGFRPVGASTNPRSGLPTVLMECVLHRED